MGGLVVFGGGEVPVGTKRGKESMQASEILVLLASRVPFWRPLGGTGEQRGCTHPHFGDWIYTKSSKARSGRRVWKGYEKMEDHGWQKGWIFRGPALENRAPVYTPCIFG